MNEGLKANIPTNISNQTNVIATTKYPMINPAIAIPFPDVIPFEFLICDIAMCPQTTAGIAVKMKHAIKPKIPQTKLVIANPEVGGAIV